MNHMIALIGIVATLAGCAPRISIGSIDGNAGGGPGSGALKAPCAVKTLATGLRWPLVLAYADQFAYVVLEDESSPSPDIVGDIVRVPLSGGAPVSVVTGVPQVQLHAFAANATDVYFGSIDGKLRSAPVSGGASTILFAGESLFAHDDPDCPESVALDGHDVYFATLNGTIRRMPLGGGPTKTLVPPQPSHFIEHLVVDATDIYWLEASNGSVAAAIKKAPIVGGSVTALMPDTNPSWFALSGDSLYVSQGQLGSMAPDGTFTGNGSIFRMRLDQSEPVHVLAVDQAPANVVTADASGVYWGGGDWPGDPASAWTIPVRRVGANAATVELIGPKGVVAQMTPCDGGICWIDFQTGSLMRYEECSL